MNKFLLAYLFYINVYGSGLTRKKLKEPMGLGIKAPRIKIMHDLDCRKLICDSCVYVITRKGLTRCIDGALYDYFKR